MTNKYTFADLLTAEASLGDGAFIIIQGGTGTGKSILAANADDPILYLNFDFNLKYVPKRAPDKRIDYAHLALPPEATDVERNEMLKKVNVLWNGFIRSEASPRFGVPHKTCVWDTWTYFWRFIWPLKVSEKIARGKDPNREAAPLDFRDANEYMDSIATARALRRPDSYVLMLMHEDILYIQDPKNPSSSFKVEDPRGRMELEGWKHTRKYAQLHVRLFRPDNALDRNGQKKPGARTAEILKFSDDENAMINGTRIYEPVWEDIKEMLEVA